MNSIEVEDLAKCFGKPEAVRSASFNVQQGEAFGVLFASG